MKYWKSLPAIMVLALCLAAAPLFAVPFSGGVLEGYFVSSQVLEGSSDSGPVVMVEIKDYDGNSYNLQVAAAADLLIDQREVPLAAFKKNLEVYAEVRGGQITLLEGYSSINPGYVAPGSRQRQGIITLIERDQLEVRLDNGQQLSCFTGPATLVTKYGTQSSLSELVAGDHVILYFDDADATSSVIFDENTLAEYSLVSRIAVMDETGQVKDVFQGELFSVDRVKPVLTFKDVQILKNGVWTDYQSSLQISYDEDNPIYLGGQQISQRNLKNYAGKDVFWVNRDRLGNTTLNGYDTIDKMVVKGQYSALFTDHITDISWYDSSFELQGKQNIGFHAGTIVIKNGRIQTSSALAAGQDVVVISDSWNGSYSAAVVMIMGDSVASNSLSQKQLYAGKLILAADNQAIISNFYWLKDNEWLSFTEDKAFFYDEDSSILVYSQEEGRLVKISSADFLAGDYVVNEDSSYARDNSLESYYAYIYSDGDRIVAMVLQPSLDALLVQRVTSARLSGVDKHATLGWRLLLKDSADWSNREDRWLSRAGSLNLYLSNALIVKNNRVITTDQLKDNLEGALASDLRADDRLLILRDDIEARIVLVQ